MSTKSNASSSPKPSASDSPAKDKQPPPHWHPKHNHHMLPKGRLSSLFWRFRLWFDVTFAVYMFEPWEAAIVYVLFAMFFVFLVIGVFRYLPAHIAFLQQRATYYLVGE